MSSARNKDLIPGLEGVGLAFAEFWCGTIQLRCGKFYFNSDFANDVFFNKLSCITCIDDEAMKDAAALFEKYGTIPYLYILNRPDLEEKLLMNNFKPYDSQHVLIKKPESTISSRVHKISREESLNWSKIFCASYDCNPWMGSVDEIVKNTSDSIGYYVDESGSSCVALYEHQSVLGLYCLGTIPSGRNRGHAASLIQFALNEAWEHKLEFLMLETYGRDNLLGFYYKLGFDEVYEKKIYTI